MTIREHAKRIGVSVATLSRFARGNPTDLETAYKLVADVDAGTAEWFRRCLRFQQAKFARQCRGRRNREQRQLPAAGE